jgi:hypothetical protein
MELVSNHLYVIERKIIMIFQITHIYVIAHLYAIAKIDNIRTLTKNLQNT